MGLIRLRYRFDHRGKTMTMIPPLVICYTQLSPSLAALGALHLNFQAPVS